MGEARAAKGECAWMQPVFTVRLYGSEVCGAELSSAAPDRASPPPTRCQCVVVLVGSSSNASDRVMTDGSSTRVWVYGSLRTGKKSHDLMRSATFEGAADLALSGADDEWVLASSVRLDWEGEGAAAVCHGEVYLVDDDTLAALDRLEGYNQPGQQDIYQRPTKTLTDGTTALVYMIRRSDAESRGKHIAGELTRQIEQLPVSVLIQRAQAAYAPAAELWDAVDSGDRGLLADCVLAAEHPVLGKRHEVVRIGTRLGDILVYLFDETPQHKRAFLQLCADDYWSQWSFNRVIKDFVIQGGYPDVSEGFAYSPHLLDPEIRTPALRHTRGAFGAGRDDNPGKISTCNQFYIVHNREGLARLDGDYTVYGFVIAGMDVVDAIADEETDKANDDQPLVPIPLAVTVERMSRREIERLGAGPGGTGFCVGGGIVEGSKM